MRNYPFFKFSLMKKYCLPGIAALFLPSGIYAQDPQTMDNPTKWDVDIKTPNAAAVERYGNTPVNLATGLPQINVPIYTIKTTTYALPVTASYHAAGIKVDDLSGDIGLGWNLSAGYTISRTLRGLPDERPNGYLKPLSGPSLIPSYEYTSSNTTIDTFKLVADGFKDTQPDEFSFSIGGFSGKFILAPGKVILLPDQDVKVEYTLVGADLSFILTDNKGIKYHFNDISTTYQISCQGDEFPYNSSWHISKITFPDTKEEITFQYVVEQQSMSSSSESKIYEYGGVGPRPVKSRSCESSILVNEKKLSQVLFPQGKLLFNYNTAKLDVTNTHAIDKIQLQNKQGFLEKEFRFNYSYYNPSSSNNLAKKLKLDSIRTFDNNNVKLSGFSFAYNGNTIPAYGAKSKDVWGYNNGKANTSLIPGNTFLIDNNNFVPGGDRTIDSGHTAKGILNKITYPTGGYTQFEFENNTAGAGCGVYFNTNDSINTVVEATVAADCRRSEFPYSETGIIFFTPSSNTTSHTIVETNQYNCTGTTLFYTLENVSTNQVLVQGMTSQGNIPLIAGHNYKLTLTTNCEDAEANMIECRKWGNVSIAYVKRVLNTDTAKYRLAGGLRVKTVTDFDQYSNMVNTRKYEYSLPNETDRSSGVMLYRPIYDYTYTYDISQANGQIATIAAHTYSSEPNNISYSGTPLFYRYVKESNGASAEGGYVLNNYDVAVGGCGDGFPFAPTANTKDRSPRLLSTKVYTTTGLLQQSTDYYYNTVLNDQVKGWKTAYSKMGFNGGAGNWGNTPNKFIGHVYHYKSEKLRLDSTVVSEYFNGNTIVTTKINDYLSTASYYPYRQRSKNSRAEEVSQTTWRVSDFSVAASGTLSGSTKALKYMKDNHLNDFIVESYLQQDGAVTDAFINEFGLLELPGKTLTTTERMYQLNTEQPLSNYTPLNKNINVNAPVLSKDTRFSLELEYKEHDANGKPRQLITKGNDQTLLLWGYGGDHLVAKIRNVSYNDLNSYLNSQPAILQTIDAPANDLALRGAIQQLRTQFGQALIEGYTYKLLTGPSSMSDNNNTITYYEYDTHGRLLNIKDADGKLLKTHQYQYQGPQ